MVYIQMKVSRSRYLRSWLILRDTCGRNTHTNRTVTGRYQAERIRTPEVWPYDDKDMRLLNTGVFDTFYGNIIST